MAVRRLPEADRPFAMCPAPGLGAASPPDDTQFRLCAGRCYRIKLDDGPERVLSKGDTFYEAPNQLHAVSRNASTTEPAKVLVVGIGEIGKPATVPERQ